MDNEGYDGLKPAAARRMLPVFAIGGLAFILYSFSMFGPPQFDDHAVFAGKTLSYMLGMCHAPRRIIANLSFAASFYLHGDRVFGYHLVNILCHIATSLGAFHLVLALPSKDRSRRLRAAWLAGLIMAAHPLATQGVSFMAQRYSCMSAAFAIWALVSYCRVRQVGGRKWSVLVFIFPLLAVLTKEYVVVLPVLAMLLELLFFRGDRQGRRRMLLGMGAMVVSLAVLGWSLYASRPKTAEVGPVPAAKTTTVTDWTFGRVPRDVYARSQLVIIPGVYVRLAFIPLGQSLDHAFTAYRDWSPPVLAGAGVLLLLLLSPLLLHKRAPVVGFGLALLVLPIIPPSSFVPNTEFVAEHRAYLAVVGFAMATGYLLSLLPPRPMIAVAALYLGILSGLTINRNLLWNDSLALWADAAYKGGDRIPRPWCAVGVEHFKRGDYAAAEVSFLRSLKVNPRYLPARIHLAMTYEQQGRLRQAHAKYRQLVLEYPDRADIIAHTSRVLLKLGEPQKAIVIARRSLELSSNNVDALLTLGQALEQTNHRTDAAGVYECLLKLGLSPEQREAVRELLKRARQ